MAKKPSRASRKAQREALAKFQHSGNLTALGICFLCFFFVTTGIYKHFIANQHDLKSDCELPFMRPKYQWVRGIKVNGTNGQPNPYKLFRYREHSYDTLKQENVTGIPAIFIPGNGGSYKQVRTIASISSFYYKDVIIAKNGKTELKQYDWYTIDTQGSLLAFDVEGLVSLTQYVEETMNVLSKRHSKRARELKYKWDGKFLVVGHSMGGIVARMLQPSRISQIITLGTPHSPPTSMAPVKKELIDLYTNLPTRSAADGRDPPSTEDNHEKITPHLISIAGGLRDSLVNSDLTKFGISVQSEGIPLAWTAADHQALSWCKQLIDQCVRYIYASQSATSEADKQKLTKVFFLDQIEPGKDFKRAADVEEFNGKTGLLTPEAGERIEIWTSLHAENSADIDATPEIRVSECGYIGPNGARVDQSTCRTVPPRLLPCSDPAFGLAPEVTPPTRVDKVTGQSFHQRPWRPTKYWLFNGVDSVLIEKIGVSPSSKDSFFKVARSKRSDAERVIDVPLLSIIFGEGIREQVAAEGVSTKFQLTGWLYSHFALTAAILSPNNPRKDAAFIQLSVLGTTETTLQKLVPSPGDAVTLTFHNASPRIPPQYGGLQLEVYFPEHEYTLYIMWDVFGTAVKFAQKYGVLLLTGIWIWTAQLLSTTMSQAYKGDKASFISRLNPGVTLIWCFPIALLLFYTGKPIPAIPLEAVFSFLLAGGSVVFLWHYAIFFVEWALIRPMRLRVESGLYSWFKIITSMILYGAVVLGIVHEEFSWITLSIISLVPQAKSADPNATSSVATQEHVNSKGDILEHSSTQKSEDEEDRLHAHFNENIRRIFTLFTALEIPYAIPPIMQAFKGLNSPRFTDAWTLLVAVITFCRLGTFTVPPNKGERLFIATLCEPFFWIPIWATSRWTGNSWLTHSALPFLFIALWLADLVARYFKKEQAAKQVGKDKKE